VVTESTKVSFFGRIDKLTFGEGHEVEVLDAFLIILVHAPPESRLRDDFANVFEDEIIRLEILVSTKTEAFLVSLDDRNVGVDLSLEALVLTAVSAAAIPGALHLGGPVDAIRIFAARIIGLRLRIYRRWSASGRKGVFRE
jgi:hypothetical protein